MAMDYLDYSINLLNLPDEVIEFIITTSSLGLLDIIHVSATCKQLRDIACSSTVWQHLSRSRWSKWSPKLTGLVLDWYQIYKARHKLESQFQVELAQMNEKYFNDDILPRQAYQTFVNLILSDDHNITTETLYEYLATILSDKSQHNLTLKYYGKRVFNNVCLQSILKEFLQMDDDKINLEEGAVIISTWLMPSLGIVHEDSVYKQLDSIAYQVQKKLINTKNGQQLLERFQNSNGYVTDYNYCRNVLSAMNEVLYNDLNFRGNRTNYYDDRNSFIDQVLHRRIGIPISLCIIYLAIARRLKVKLDPIGFPGHFLLRLQRSETVYGDATTAEVFIDAFDHGKLLNQNEAFDMSPNPSHKKIELLQPIKNRQVLARMVRNLTNIYQNNFRRQNMLTALINSLRLILLLCPEDEDNHSFLTRLLYHFHVYDEEVIRSAEEKAKSGIFKLNLGHLDSLERMKELKQKSRKHELKVKRRPPHVNLPTNVIYKVGMMMQHRRYNYTCVIYGWDYECRMTQAWVTQMGVDMLPNGTKQPFYNVLVEDGSQRYAAQENLRQIEEQIEPCPNAEVGKFFQSFTGTNYVPNDQLRIRYPDY
ncbi:F-box only protein 21 [Trichoplax sp. H2]|nr:F-box only protein 21 [Trichoplax sp. H2]|eukprot:RDD46506.1 F-box only protein 21 [Trichoplax sp. H2]